MKQLSSSEVRQMFIDFFKGKGHKVEPSAPLVPHEDPTLLWINSGVATLKKYFDGRVVPENPRITNAQKSIRTNDIENVGITARHHTFFEMLGNFSIGDYFKKEAIEWAWEFLTSEKWIGFDADKLSVTIHPEDKEAFDLWKNMVGLPEERIIRLEGNFWDIGEGPSGPNSEIFYDRGEAYGNDQTDPEMYPGGENDRYLEIWNLVFSQFNHNADGTYTPLPKKNIDTGMGLERMVSVIQDTKTNFETDLFMPIIKQIEKFTDVQYGNDREQDTSFKVIADHVRSVTFAISDGALPSNEGRGYVLRRLIRRAVRFAKFIGIEKPFMYELVPTVANIMEAYYPEVQEKVAFVQKVIKNEEERFHETINEGLAILTSVLEKAKSEGENVVSGEDAFRLYDTYGFPLELTEEYVAEQGMTVNIEQFNEEMKAQRERARSARHETQSMQVQSGILGEITVSSEFVGYEQFETNSTVVALIKDEELVQAAKQGEELQIFLDKTPFYAESGGQIADRGLIIGENFKATVKNVQKAPNGQNIHTITIEEGTIHKDDKVLATINLGERTKLVKNHTATHLLHQALKDVLGKHVNQAGSLVTPERLRFDFSHFSQVTAEELDQVEEIVNNKIWDAMAVNIMYKPIDEAKAMGAMALFGEKYGKIVRVVKAGDYSLELCGGCHVNNTSEIGLFKIKSETGIGAGTRRIEAVTGKEAYNVMHHFVQLLKQSAIQLKTKMDQVPERVDGVQNQIRDLTRENESLKGKLAAIEAGQLTNETVQVDGINILVKKIDDTSMNELRTIVDDLKNQIGSGIIVLGSPNNGKVNLIAGVTKDLVTKGYHAGKLIKEIAPICGGGGGGRPDLAQAGGKDPAKLDEALQFVHEWVKSIS